jgi:hypothetical protein
VVELALVAAVAALICAGITANRHELTWYGIGLLSVDAALSLTWCVLSVATDITPHLALMIGTIWLAATNGTVNRRR